MDTPTTTQTISAGTTLTITAHADDPAGNLQEHWLEIKRPAGDWSWEGWLTNYPWEGSLTGTNYASSKSGSFTFTTTGTYVVRSTALNTSGQWVISSEISVIVTSANSSVTLSSPTGNVNLTAGDSLTISGSATNSSGYLQEHCLEIKRPAGDWSWEGWLTSYPWEGSLNGNGYNSSKSGSFTFTDVGTYVVRTTAMDVFGNWQISTEYNVTVSSGANHAPTASIVLTGSVPIAGGKWVSVASAANDQDGNLSSHFIGFSTDPNSAVTSTVASGGSSLKTYTTFIPTGGFQILWTVATDTAGANHSTFILLN